MVQDTCEINWNVMEFTRMAREDKNKSVSFQVGKICLYPVCSELRDVAFARLYPIEHC
jgi:hypothetical protein